jgi:hypothetical protein
MCRKLFSNPDPATLSMTIPFLWFQLQPHISSPNSLDAFLFSFLGRFSDVCSLFSSGHSLLTPALSAIIDSHHFDIWLLLFSILRSPFTWPVRFEGSRQNVRVPFSTSGSLVIKLTSFSEICLLRNCGQLRKWERCKSIQKAEEIEDDHKNLGN